VRSGESSTVVKTDLSNQAIAAGRYEVQHRFGKGSMGHVFHAVDTRLKRNVVIKVPTESRLADPEFHERFLREARLLTQLSHPGIVKILDVGDQDGVPYFVMPYLSGGNLLDRMKGEDGKPRPLLPESLADWLPRMAEALDFMHVRGYIHRDVKPANILFDEHGHAYLSDFGLSKILERDDERGLNGLTAANAVVGTPNYVAPELVLARRDYDGRVDQYSLAVTVYEVLAGKPPLEGGSPAATMVNQTTKHPKPLHDVAPVPLELGAAVRRAMSKRVWRRFESCTQFAQAVQAALEGSHSSAVSASSRSSTTAYSTVVETRLEYFAAATSRSENGVVLCPACHRPLMLKEKYAGQCGSCVHCGGKLMISKDLSELTLLRQLPPGDARLEAAPSAEGPTPDGGEMAEGRCEPEDRQLALAEGIDAEGLEWCGVRFRSRGSLVLAAMALCGMLAAAALAGRQSAVWLNGSPELRLPAPQSEVPDSRLLQPLPM
jgi:serine/threonine-protein kinase